MRTTPSQTTTKLWPPPSKILPSSSSTSFGLSSGLLLLARRVFHRRWDEIRREHALLADRALATGPKQVGVDAGRVEDMATRQFPYLRGARHEVLDADGTGRLAEPASTQIGRRFNLTNRWPDQSRLLPGTGDCLNVHLLVVHDRRNFVAASAQVRHGDFLPFLGCRGIVRGPRPAPDVQRHCFEDLARSVAAGWWSKFNVRRGVVTSRTESGKSTSAPEPQDPDHRKEDHDDHQARKDSCEGLVVHGLLIVFGGYC